MVKKTFTKPEHEIIRLENNDIIVTSAADINSSNSYNNPSSPGSGTDSQQIIDSIGNIVNSIWGK